MRPTSNVCFLRQKVAPLPYDAELEYLESTSTGGQYIDTGLKLTKDMKFEYSFSLLRKGSNQTLFGSNNVTSTDSVIAYQTSRQANLALRFLDSITSGFYQAYGKGFIVLKIQNQYAGFYDTNGNLLSEQSFSDATTTPNNNNIFLLCGNNNGTAVNPVIEFKFGYFKVWRGDLPVMDLIPVRVGSEGCMYDKVTGTLFHNAGTGDFILGNDI